MNPVPNMNNNNMQNPPQQKMQSQILTFGNQIFSSEQPETFGNKQIMENNGIFILEYNNGMKD